MFQDQRTQSELRAHYELEKRLAARLRAATREERRHLYRELYDELYRKVPFLKTDPRTIDKTQLEASLRLLRPYLGSRKTFLEVGAGNLALSRVIAPLSQRVVALDVSKEFATALGAVPANVEVVLSDGLSVPVEPASIDVAYSSQLMEHLHPEDAFEQLQNILCVLKPGGVYICNTPHRLNGPHDISQYFDEEATGFHLKEYTNRELCDVFLRAGFRRVYSLTGVRGYVAKVPVAFIVFFEDVLSALPKTVRKIIAKFLPVKILLGVRLVGVK